MRIDQATRRAEDVLAALAPVALVGTDERWVVVAANDAAADLCGRTVEDLVGRSFGVLLTRAGQALLQSRYAGELLARGVIHEVATEVLRADGQRVPVLLSGRVAGDAGVAVVTALTPAADRRAHERALLDARRQAEASERYLAHLNRVTRQLAAARTVGEVEGAVTAHLHALGVAEPAVEVRAGAEVPVVGRPGTGGDDRPSSAGQVSPARTWVLDGPDGVVGALAVHGAVDLPDRGDLAVTAGTRASLAAHVEAIVPGVEQALTRVVLLDRLAQEARTDALTGLANRRRFDAALRAAVDAHAVDGLPLTLVYLDLDGFKAVNDDGGHAAGDRELLRVAVALRGAVRGGDLVARLGGDEFAVLSRAVPDEASARRMADVLAAAIGAVRSGGRSRGASAGVVHVDAGTACPPADALLRVADQAMYAVKRPTPRA